MRKKDVRRKKMTFPIKITIGKVYLGVCLCILIYVFCTPVLTFLLKQYGRQCKGVIIYDTSSYLHRWTNNNYLYEFKVGNKVYTGNSLIKEGNKARIGDSIEVLYFPLLPKFNRPVVFFK